MLKFGGLFLPANATFRGFMLSLVGLWGCDALHAQLLPPCLNATSGCTVGSSLSFDFAQFFDLPAGAILSAAEGFSYTYSFVANSGVPPGLTLSPSGLLGGTFTAAGQFTLNLTLTETTTGLGTSNTETFVRTFQMVVTGYSGPPVTVEPSALRFNLTQNAASVTQSLTVANYGNQALQFSASATTNSGGNWLQLSPTSGSVASGGTSALAITVDPSDVTPGTYSGTITISAAGGQPLAVAVLAVVTGAQPNIQLSQTGGRFQAVVGGTATSPQTITVLNPGPGTLNFTASASTLAGGNWLSVSPSSGTTSASAAGVVTVTVTPTGLQPGNYYGTVQFSASGAVNSPQVASVVLNVVSPANSPGGFVQPTGLIFVGSAGGTDPAAQTLSITNPSPDALTFVASAFSNGASSWLAATPSSGSVSAAEPAMMSVQPSLTGLTPGVYLGDLALVISAPTASGTPQDFHNEIALIVLPADSSPSVRPALRPHAASCMPTQLLPVFTLLGTGFTATAGWPTAIEVTVVDDCGNPLLSGSVTVMFSSGDPALSLESLNDGRWSATWDATHVASSVTITALAQELQPALTGTSFIGGTLQPNTATPAVSSGGVVSAANFAANQPLAPGAFAAIFGTNLSGGLNVASQLPLSLQLGGTSVVLGAEQLPLLFTSGRQVNVVVPYDVPVNSTQQLVVQSGTAISIPQSVVIATAQPAIFTQNGSGTGAALIQVFKSDGTELLNNSPVTAGDVIILYCSGLGAVKPPVAAGSPAPDSPLSKTVNPVTATIGQAQAQVEFAGLAPSFAQLYQVNVQIPSGLPSGNAVLTLSVSGQQSAPVSIAVQ